MVSSSFRADLIAAQMQDAVTEGLAEASEVLLAHAIDRTPWETKTLRNSAKAHVNGNEAGVSYNTPYAGHVHENLDAHHPHGEAKFLEKAVNDFGAEFTDIVAARIRAAMG